MILSNVSFLYVLKRNVSMHWLTVSRKWGLAQFMLHFFYDVVQASVSYRAYWSSFINLLIYAFHAAIRRSQIWIDRVDYGPISSYRSMFNNKHSILFYLGGEDLISFVLSCVLTIHNTVITIATSLNNLFIHSATFFFSQNWTFYFIVY